MSDWLLVGLSLSLSGSLLFVLLLLLRPLFRRRVSYRWQYYIWLVVVLRLLLPFTPPASLMGALAHNAEAISTAQPDEPEPAPAITVPDAAGEWAGESLPGGPVPAPDPEPPADMESGAPGAERSAVTASLWLLWPAIGLVLLIRKVTVYQSFSRYVLAGREEVDDPALLDLLSDLCELAGQRRMPELYTHGMISSPLLMGLRKPCIVLPTADVSGDRLRYILLHEIVHHRRRDLWYKWLVQLALCVHWFNPLAYRMEREISQACELSCDEGVLALLSEAEHRDYGATLLDALGNPGKYREATASLALSENASKLKERLDAIMRYHGKNVQAAAIATCLTLAFTSGALFSGAYAGNRAGGPYKAETDAALPGTSGSLPSPSGGVPDGGRVDNDSTAFFDLDNLPEQLEALWSTGSGWWSGDSNTFTNRRPNPYAGRESNINTASVTLDGASVKQLELDSRVGDLIVKKGNVLKIEVGPKMRGHAIYEMSGGTLRLYDNLPETMKLTNEDLKDYAITVTVPDRKYDRIQARTCLGELELTGLQAATFQAGNSSGTTTLSGLRAGKLALDLSLGSADLSAITATGDIKIDSSSTSVAMQDVGASSLAADASLGSLTMKNVRTTGAQTLRTSSTAVELQDCQASKLDANLSLGGLQVSGGSVSGPVKLNQSSTGVEIGGLKADSLEVQGSLGHVQVRNSSIAGAIRYQGQSGGITVTDTAAGLLSVKGSLANIDAAGVTLGGLSVSTQSGGADISGTVRGEIKLVDEGLSSISLELKGVARTDYRIQATSSGASDKYSKPTFMLNGEAVNFNHSDASGAYPLIIESRDSFSSGISVRFA